MKFSFAPTIFQKRSNRASMVCKENECPHGANYFQILSSTREALIFINSELIKIYHLIKEDYITKFMMLQLFHAALVIFLLPYKNNSFLYRVYFKIFCNPDFPPYPIHLNK